MFKSEDSWYTPECCRYCSNNPRNNPSASGVCNCVLPSMEMSGYRSKGNYNNTFTTTTTTSYIFYKEN